LTLSDVFDADPDPVRSEALVRSGIIISGIALAPDLRKELAFLTTNVLKHRPDIQHFLENVLLQFFKDT
jgi:hypothetical protein